MDGERVGVRKSSLASADHYSWGSGCDRWHLICPEFACVCPITGQPDFATIRIRYIPDRLCVELKSLKLYLWSYREEGAFHETVTNRILDDLVAAVRPKEMTVTGDFAVRGGIHTVVTATHRRGAGKKRR